MGYVKTAPSKKEKGYLLLGLVIGALLGLVGNFAVTSYFKIFSPSGLTLNIIFVLSLGGFIILIAWLISLVQWLSKIIQFSTPLYTTFFGFNW
jgi:hypothetical protein